MSSKTSSALETAIENLSSPWDLVAISAGVATAAIAAALGSWSFETLLPIGAFGGVAIRKAIQSFQERPRLRRRAKGLIKELSSIGDSAEDQANILEHERSLWEDYVTTNAEFSDSLDRLVPEVRSLWNNRQVEKKEIAKQQERSTARKSIEEKFPTQRTDDGSIIGF